MIAFNVCIKLLTNKDTHFLPAQRRSIPSMLLFPRIVGYLGSPHSFVQGHLVYGDFCRFKGKKIHKHLGKITVVPFCFKL